MTTETDEEADNDRGLLWGAILGAVIGLIIGFAVSNVFLWFLIGAAGGTGIGVALDQAAFGDDL